MDIHCSPRPSGAVSILERVPYSHSVTIGFWFNVGSGNENEAERGFTHFIEHMMFKGTVSRDALALAKESERAGGFLNAFTERSCLCIHCTFPVSTWPIAVELLGDMAFHSVFDRKEFEREKAVVHSEVLAAKDDPEEDSSDEFHARIWKGHPLSRRIAGEPEDVEKMQRDELYRYYKENFNPGNLTITAVGNFDPGEMEHALDEALIGLQKGKPCTPSITPLYQPGTWMHPASTEQVYLIAGTIFPRGLSRDELYAMDALNCAFGESSSSRLFQNIRENHGLCYSIGSSFASMESFGAFYISAVCTGSAFKRLWDRIQKELDVLRETGLAKEEVSDAVAHLYGQDMVAADDTDVRMRALARQWMRYGSVEPYMSLIEGIRSVDVDKVLGARDTIFSAPISVLAYGRVGSQVRKALGI